MVIRRPSTFISFMPLVCFSSLLLLKSRQLFNSQKPRQVQNLLIFLQIFGFLLIVGIARRSHWFLLPWLVIDWIVILTLLGLILVDFAVGGTYSQYLTMNSGCVVFSLFNWIAASITFWQIRHENVKLSSINDLDYIHLTNLSSSVMTSE